VSWIPRTVEWRSEAKRDLRGLDAPLVKRIVRVVDRYAATGHGDVKQLQGVDQRWRLRIGDWRVLFTLDHGRLLVLVLRVLPRGSAYR
jgi:mRNA interferase RelE/StbE